LFIAMNDVIKTVCIDQAKNCNQQCRL